LVGHRGVMAEEDDDIFKYLSCVTLGGDGSQEFEDCPSRTLGTQTKQGKRGCIKHYEVGLFCCEKGTPA